jgi:hypothetical protein
MIVIRCGVLIDDAAPFDRKQDSRRIDTGLT